LTLTRATRADALSGRFRPPGDKSISHRALMLGAVSIGLTRISGLLESADVLATANALESLGAGIKRDGDDWLIEGCGIGGLKAPVDVLNMGNSGTGARLLMGILASHPFSAIVSGDASLNERPMGRIIEPLTQMGAAFEARDGGRLPLTLKGATSPLPLTYTLPVPSAQVKSAILLAALNTPGETTIIEPIPCRDHTERMLAHFGADLRLKTDADGRWIILRGERELTGRPVHVPADPSSAAFPLVAALIRPGSQITLEGVSVNPLRTGLFDTLRQMGADIAFGPVQEQDGEPVADITCRASTLKGITVPPERAPAMIDEYPVLAIAAAMAEGTTTMRGLGELRVKESDRLAVMAKGLAACGVDVEELDDGLIIHGKGNIPGGARVESHLDHRIAMSFLVLGGAAENPIEITGGATIDTSFPGFAKAMNGLGAHITEEKTSP